MKLIFFFSNELIYVHFMSTLTKDIYQTKLNYKIHHFSTFLNLVDFNILDLYLHSKKFFTLTIYSDGKYVFVLAFKNKKLISINSKLVNSHTIIQKINANSIIIKNPMKNFHLEFSFNKLTKFRYNNTLHKNLVVTLRSYNL